jgi:DME family drug/metabolite transporter
VVNPVFALVPAIIWALSPIYYRIYLGKFDLLTLNFVRTTVGAAGLLVPALLFGFNQSLVLAVVSGVVTLAVGDSLFLVAIREAGASIAAPVVYTYVLLIQLTASFVGESVPFINIISALLIILGILLLSRGGGGRPKFRGILVALAASLVWTVGQELIKAATNAGGNFFAVAFARDGSAAVALGVVLLLRGRTSAWKVRATTKDLAFLSVVGVTDLAVGSALYVYSISAIGLAITVILTSVSPFLTQIFSRVLGKETPSNLDYAGGALIVFALVLAVL